MKRKRSVPRMHFTKQVCALLVNNVQIHITWSNLDVVLWEDISISISLELWLARIIIIII